MTTPDPTPSEVSADTVDRLAARLIRIAVYGGGLPGHDERVRRQWTQVYLPDERDFWRREARALLDDLGLSTPATDPAPAAEDEVARLQELLSYIELHVNWRWLSGKCTTEQREMWADAVDRFSDGSPRADRWWRGPAATQATAEPVESCVGDTHHWPGRMNPGEERPCQCGEKTMSLDVVAPWTLDGLSGLAAREAAAHPDTTEEG